MFSYGLLCIALLSSGWSQTDLSASASAAANSSPPGTNMLTLAEALRLAKINAPEYRTALTDAGIAREDHVQARAALLPGVSYSTGMIYTQGNGTSTGRFIGANGVHEYVSQGIAHEALSFTSVADLHRTAALEALGRARAEIAQRGLVTTVVQNFYGAIVSQRKTHNAQLAAGEANRFLNLSQKLERGGEVAHSDVLKAQLQANDRERDLQEASLGEEKAKLDLAVLVYPSFRTDFQLVDDLQQTPALPDFDHLQQLASRNNPTLAAAITSLKASTEEVKAAIGGHLPSFSINYFYGIDASQYATRTDSIQNLGYQIAATIDIPIFNWGATQSQVKQAQLRRDQARVELSAAQREAIANLQLFYNEARTARGQLDLLRQSADVAAESLRLTTLRYQGGEATALEVVDAQNAFVSAQNNFDDGSLRYRVAIANLQTLTGTF